MWQLAPKCYSNNIVTPGEPPVPPAAFPNTISILDHGRNPGCTEKVRLNLIAELIDLSIAFSTDPTACVWVSQSITRAAATCPSQESKRFAHRREKQK